MTQRRALTAIPPPARGFFRAACATPRVALADPAANARRILELAQAADKEGAALVVFPELSVTGYSNDDLVFQDALLDGAERALAEIAAGSENLAGLLLVGAPLRWRDRIYNCAVAVAGGAILGVTPKTHLPNYREFYELRYFASGGGIEGETIRIAGQAAPFGVDLIYAAENAPGADIAVEICEDLWAAIPPSASAALAGAKIIANLSASNAVIGKEAHREILIAAHSSRCVAAYAFCSAGTGESTTDLAWDGQATIHENGARLAASPRFARGPQLCVADIDLDTLRLERARLNTYRDAQAGRAFRRIAFRAGERAEAPLRRAVPRFPFIPDDPARAAQDCFEAYNIQVRGLTQRLESSGVKRIVLGVSGGLDSTQALIVAAQAMDELERPRADILAFSLPGFATGEATRANAAALAASLGATFEEIDIRPAAKQMLADLAHPFASGEAVYDVTFENVQAGLRTDYLFRIANQREGLVLGTGDLSELALGWCTYGVGDQMSHYNVNAGAPKTLIQHLIRWNARRGAFGPEASAALERILATEISPELVPPDAAGAMQSTESAIGPYALHDFFLFHTLRGQSPAKIAYLAACAWSDARAGAWPEGAPRVAFTDEEILKWLRVFARRFFQTSQFKRSAMPNGPKLLAGGSLSPRGDWRAPSDAAAAVWLADIERALEVGRGS